MCIFTVAAIGLSLIATAVHVHLQRASSTTTPGGARHDPDLTVAGRSAGADWYNARAFPRDTIPPDGYARGVRQANHLHKFLLDKGGWQELGPMYAPNAGMADPKTHRSTPVAGRVTSLAVDPSTCSAGGCRTIYGGAASGGVWKTTDAGRTWTPLTDSQPDLAVGAITLDPQNPNIVYVGTGDPDHGFGSHRGIGILRSTDGGQTWTDLGYDQFANRGITSILVDPRTAGTTGATLYVTSSRAGTGGAPTERASTSDNPYLPPMGFSYSQDGGQTWSRSNPDAGFTDRTGGVQARDLVMDPSDPNILYVTISNSGIYKSTDDGQSWTALTSGLPNPGKLDELVKVAIAPSNPHVLYAAFDIDFSTGTDREVLFRSSDAGASWDQLSSTPNACGTQCYQNMRLAVDPTNPNVVYAGGTANYDYLWQNTPENQPNPACKRLYPLPTSCNATLMKSTDGGNTWADIGESNGNGPLHPDLHALYINPSHPNLIYLGLDGGVFYTSDGGRSWHDLNRGVGNLQVQAFSIGPNGRIYAGTQDNGTFMYRGSTTWSHVDSGDGGLTAADPKNVKISYNTNTGASLYRNDSSGNPNKNIDIAPFWADYYRQQRGQFYEPYALAPSNPKDIFFGTYRIWRSALRGGIDGNHDYVAYNDKRDKTDWVPISFDLSCAAQPSDPALQCDSEQNAGQGISTLAVSPINPNVVAVGTANGHLWLTKNALARVRTARSCDPRKNRDRVAQCTFLSGVRWSRIDNGLPARFPTSIKFAPRSSTKLLVTFSGFDENTPSTPGHVFVSSSGGRSWTNLNGSGSGTSLPDLPFDDIAINARNGHLYASADYGVYISTDDGATWNLLTQGMPGVSAYQLQLDARSQLLVAGTYGRGIWALQAP